LFFERFREAAARLPDGLIRPAPPATLSEIAAAEGALGARLPAEYASFLRSFDGADLFHEAVVIAGVGPAAPRALLELGSRAGELVFAEAVAGDRFALDGAGRVWRLRAGSDERILAGSSFGLWLDACVARERLLYGSDGEFAPDVFDEDGEEIAPATVVRQMERALKVDPGSAEAEHERGVALRRLGRGEKAVEAFAAATALDPENPWPWFDLGRTALAVGRDLPRAREAFLRAAEREPGPAGARLLAWAARAALAAGDEAEAAEARRNALARDPGLLDQLSRAESQAAQEGDQDARAENEALRLALAPRSAPRRSLRVIDVAPIQATGGAAAPGRATPRSGGPAEGPAPPRERTPPPPSAHPPRPGPTPRPRGGGSPRAGRPGARRGPRR
jgi:tetratricopeptide (TPR) repeat protein